ncbi:unnamed protein product [Rhizophagus irregularis]|nr:unnamed protein product [Rhizophagus irregularis]
MCQKFLEKIQALELFNKANVIGKYMVISFGDGYDRKVESDILLLDISNNEKYIWTTKFDHSISNDISSPSSSTPTLSPTLSPTLPPSLLPSPSPSPPLLLNNKLVGVIIGSLFSGIFLSVGVFFVYKWYKNRQKQRENEFEKDIQISSLQKPMVC